MSEYDDIGLSASEAVRTVADGTRDGMVRVLRIGATGLQSSEDAEPVAAELDWLSERLMECALLAGTMAAVLRGGSDD